MSTLLLGKARTFLPLAITLFALALGACSDGKDGTDGTDGADGLDGTQGAAGIDGISCWDLNANGQPDPEEDINGDATIDVYDCNPYAGGAYGIEQLHKGYFTEHNYEGTDSCLDCHGPIGDDMLESAHFNWQGVTGNITDHDGEIHGKNDLLNNFCIAVPSNEGRCTQCHTGYGYADATFNFDDARNVDCLVCHDQTGTYKKGLTIAGRPDPGVDLAAVARSVAENGGVPTRANCIDCHANAGGGDNVKHGDIAMSMLDTTREYDVHMGIDGANYSCVECHNVKNALDGQFLDHGIGQMPLHSVDEGSQKGCVDCHGDRYTRHVGTTVETIVANHTTLACQVCHIPAFARETSTKVEWYWAEAGQDISPTPTDTVTGRATYDKKKGSFVWAKDVRPSLLYFDGKWDRMMINVNDRYTEAPVVLAAPSADYTTEGAMIYPFKKMVGNQPADAVNKTVLVPHLFGLLGGPNPYWAKYDWDLALRDGADYTGQEYTGNYEFVDTVMYLTVNHEIAPKQAALGYGNACVDCHTDNQINWTDLGWSDDPILGGERP